MKSITAALPKLKLDRRTWLSLAGGAVFVLVCTGLFLATNGLQGSQSRAGWMTGCSDKNRVTMTRPPINLENIDRISPLGMVNGAQVTPDDELTFYRKAISSDPLEVYAMADGVIKDIRVQAQSTAGQPQSYRITIQHSCQTISSVDNLTSLSPELQRAASSFRLGSISVSVKAGQTLGRVQTQPLAASIYNLNMTLPGFISPELYRAEFWKLHTDEFFTYFSEPQLSSMLALDERKVRPYSGRVDYDQPGRLIGNWFEQNTRGYSGKTEKNLTTTVNQTGHLAIFYDPIQGTLPFISTGSFGKDGPPMAFGVAAGSADPATIGEGSGLVKYELIPRIAGVNPLNALNQPSQSSLVAGVALFKVESHEKLRAEFFPGKSLSQATDFSSEAKLYER